MIITRCFIVFCLFISSLQLNAQDEDAATYDTFLTRYFVQLTRLDSTLQTVVLENEEFTGHATDAGAILTGYYSNGQLVRIKSSIGLSNHIKTEDFFFKNGQLVYAQKETFVFLTDSTGIDHSKTKKVFASECYFENEKWQTSGTDGPSKENAVFFEKVDPDALLLKAKEYSALLAKKKK